MKALAKLRREILIALSKVGLKSATVRRGHLRFKIPLFHGMGRFLFVTYEPWRKKVLRAVSKMNPDTVFDVGINVGQTMLDIQEIMPKVKYFGFEPNPACVFYTNELAKLNDFKQVSILPFGLGSTSKMARLYSKGWDDASSSIVDRPGATYSSVIYTRSGDEFVSEQGVQNISFLKIDTEGYEFQVLKGLKATIKSNLPIIFCEIFSGKKENQELYQFLTDLDYEVFDQGEGFSLHRMSSKEVFRNPCHDYIFAPRNKSEEFEKHFTND